MKRKLQKLISAFRQPGKIKKYALWLWQVARPFWPSLLLMVGIDLFTTLIGFGSSFVSKNVVDTASQGQPFQRALVVMILLSALSIGIGAAVGILRTLINERFSFDIRTRVFDRILSADFLGLNRFHSGDLLTRLTSDADTIATSIASAIPSLAMIFARLLIAFVLLYRYSPVLALSALILAPAGLIVTLVTGRKLKKLSVEVKESEAAYRSFLQEHSANIAVVKTFCREEESKKRMAQLRNRALSAVKRRVRLSTLTGLLIRSVFSLGYFISFGYCVHGLYTGSLSYGTMTLFLSLFSQIQQPLIGLSHLIPQAIGVVASAGRVMEIEEIPADSRTGCTDTAEEISLRFSHVDFAYQEKTILRDVSFTAQPHELIGIMGASGVGKTTLIRLALSLVSPGSGQVDFCYGGKEEPASADSRRHIAYVPQGNTLLSGTIRENLLFGNPEATEQEMWRALEDSAASFVHDLPKGLDTPMGEKASGISEGQAQRIAIARALLRKAPVLVLDEATSALDAHAEEKILSMLTRPGREYAPLCLIITHRRSMLPYFDQLIEIGENGEAAVTRQEQA